MGIFTFNNLLSAVKMNGLSESFLPPMILNMSITASVIILFVLLARLALKKAPKIFSYALWAVVLFRLLCPVSVTTDFSLLGLFDAPAVENTQHTTAVEYIPYDVVHTPNLEVQLPVPPAINDAVNDTLPQEHAALGADPLEGEFAIGSLVWLLGIGAMAIYSAVSYIRLRRKLVGSVLLRDNIYLADGIGSPFVMGFFRPKIYLPSALSEQEQGYIILHEQHHIRRGDHIIKALAFIALCIHWFNPLVWVAFVLSSKDMEMSCDEAVVKKLGEGIRADYSASLLSLATGRRIIAGTPLAFGEGDTKSRIKNMLNWKQAKPAVVFLSAAAVVLVLLICGTNASKDANSSGNNWVNIKYNAREVELTCNLEEPVRSYAIYEDIYENGLLISSSPRIMDRFLEDGGVTPRRFTFSLAVQSVYAESEEGFAGELNCTWAGVGGGNWKTALPKAHYTGSGQVFPEREGKQKLDTEDSVTLLMALLSTQDNGSLTMQHKDQTLMECNDTVVVYRLVTSSEGIEKYTIEGNSPTVNNVYGTANDVSYYLELAAGETFQDMSLEKRVSLLVEYEDLLDDYTLIARESTDGKTAYIVGQYNGDPTQSPLHGMYSIDMYTGEEEYFRFLYREDEVETVEAVVAANKTEFPPSAGYRIEDSVISWTENSGLILIQPKENSWVLDTLWNRYFYTPNGREYIVDAVSRGIDVCGRTDTYLYVYRIDQRFGEIAERIALTNAEAQAILTEERVKIAEGYGFSATLHIDGHTTYFNERDGIPQSVIDIAVEQCNYQFASPSDIIGGIVEATLDLDDLDTTLRADKTDLPRLKEILENAEFGYIGSCGYGAKLTLTLSNGEKLVLFKGTDGCDTIAFGSYSGYLLGEQENIEFWEMFGIDPENKVLVETNPAEDPVEEEEPSDKEQNSIVNTPFAGQALNGQSPLNGMFERTYETQLRMMRNIDQSYPFFESQTLEFDSCAVLLGERMDLEDYSRSGAAYILFRDGIMRQLPLPVDANGYTICPSFVQQTDSNTLTYTIGTEKSTCTYTINLSDRTASMTVGAATNEPQVPAEPPSEDLIRAALADKHTENALQTYGTGTLSSADFLTFAYTHLAQTWESETTYTFYSDVLHAAYALSDGKYNRVDEASVPTKLTFAYTDGAWKLTERWTPGSSSSVGVVFPAEVVEILERKGPEYYNPLPDICDDNAVRFYADQTGRVPSKTFTPADVEFTGQTLGAMPDDMTYEDRLAWVQAGPNYNESYTSMGKHAEGAGCIAYVCTYVGVPHQGAYVFELRFADGMKVNLPLPRDGFWSSALPDIMKFEEKKFIYETTFNDEALSDEGQSLIHLKGTYHYEVDLEAKTVSLTVLQ